MSVEWHDLAKDRLADIWVTTPQEERGAVEAAVNDINARLDIEAQFLGESRRPNERVCFRHPLMVLYHFSPGNPVWVVHVARLRPWTANE